MRLKSIYTYGNNIILYHGTTVRDIAKFDLSKSRDTFLDYGKGIYFTTNEEQAKQWATRHSSVGVVYTVRIDLSGLKIKQYLNYSNEFINTFCLCRAGLESDVKEIQGYDAIYGCMIDNDRETIVKIVNDYVLGATEQQVRSSIKLLNAKDQFCIKTQEVLDKISILNIRLIKKH